MKNNATKRHTAFSLPSLLLSFGAAAGLFNVARAAESPAPPQIPPSPVTQTLQMEMPAGHTYWRHPQYDAVVEVWENPGKGLRGKVIYINPADKQARTAIGRILQKDEKDVTTADVKSFVGMEGDLHLHRDNIDPEKWTGSVYWPYKEKSYGLDVKQTTADTLHVRGFFLSFPIFGRSVDLKRTELPKTQIAIATQKP